MTPPSAAPQGEIRHVDTEAGSLSYTLIRSRRKTLAIHITKEATVEVRAPVRTPEPEIRRFIAKKEKWIKEHLVRRESANNAKRGFALRYGSEALFYGRVYPIREKAGNRAGFDGEGFYAPPELAPVALKEAVVLVYKMMAKRILPAKALEFAREMNVKPAAVRINSAQSRWGSCSGKRSINFSWRLIMAEEDVIDYVVVHELAHLIELNHSPRFWSVVEGILPDYRARQKKLKQLQEKLAEEDWE